jgi:hypothetical protein
MKFIKAVFLVTLFIISYSVKAQVDSIAVSILDNMSDILSNLSSCKLHLNTQYDIYNEQLGLVKNSDQADIFLKAPNKVLVQRWGDKGKKNVYYDGATLTYYSIDNKQYATAPAPATIMDMIDEFHDKYGIDFPAADVFYADFVDQLLDISNTLAYLGVTNVNDKECFHIAGATDSLTYQIWVTKDGTFLPVKIGIVYLMKPGTPQYEAMYSAWELNPAIEDSMFDFIPPPDVKKIKLILKTQN